MQLNTQNFLGVALNQFEKIIKLLDQLSKEDKEKAKKVLNQLIQKPKKEQKTSSPPPSVTPSSIETNDQTLFDGILKQLESVIREIPKASKEEKKRAQAVLDLVMRKPKKKAISNATNQTKKPNRRPTGLGSFIKSPGSQKKAPEKPAFSPRVNVDGQSSKLGVPSPRPSRRSPGPKPGRNTWGEFEEIPDYSDEGDSKRE